MSHAGLDMDRLIAKIRPKFSTVILNRGWHYYLEGAVEELVIQPNGIISARVWGSSKYKVAVNLKSFASSSCTCPFGSACKHMAAVLFEACDVSGYEAETLLRPSSRRKLEAIEAMKEIEAGAEQAAAASRAAAVSDAVAAAQAPGKKAAKPKKPNVTPPMPTGSPQEWQLYFRKQFAKAPLYGSGSFERFYTDVTSGLFPYSDQWEQTLQTLYRLHVLVYLMERAEDLYRGNSYLWFHYEYSVHYTNCSRQCGETAAQLISKLDAQEAALRYPLHVAELKDKVSQLLFPDLKRTAMCWPLVYNLLWSGLFINEPGIAEERRKLQRLLEFSARDPIRSDEIWLALCYLDVLEGDDKGAFERLGSRLNYRNAEVYFVYLDTFYLCRDWNRLVVWLGLLSAKLRYEGPYQIKRYFHYWVEARKYAGSDVEARWRQTALEMLPASFPYLAAELIQSQRYEEWADLCFQCETPPSELNPEDLKIVAANNAKLLLPIYHQAVESFIMHKNRDAYKQAVKLLKKLRQLYKTLKNERRWDQYIMRISGKYSRYRAFQEELKKGKLLL